jgi:CheY-like chemotaxis protein
MESVGLLAGGVAHDFNNMLGVILGTAELAIAQVDEAQPLHADLLEIRKAAVRSADLTRQLLAFARQQTIAPVVLDLNETLPGMLAMLQRLIGEDISLHWQPTASLWPVKMDRSQMDQILTNLCVNARHAIADVGTVTIATANVVADAAFCAQHAEAVPGDYVRLSVRDTGCGMDEATLARIFEPFFSTKGVGQGTGLGLATVYGAVRQNQGLVTVASALGEGTTFEIYLPRHQGAPTPAPQIAPGAADHRGGETILLVEDEPSLIRLVTKALEAQGYVVLAANSAADALRLATAYADEIHLLVSDVVMPEMNGRDLALALLQLRPTLKPLFMSGFTADVIATRGLLAPGVAFIEKPFTPVALAAKVRAVLDGQ